MLRRSLAAVVACALALAAAAVPASAADRHCAPADWAMQCHYGQASSLLGVSPLVTPTVVAQGIDAAWSKPTVAWLRRAGARFVAGYASTDASKNLTAGWVRAYQAAGFSTVIVWETTSTRALSGFAGGQSDAHRAIAQASAAGEPSSRPIYFGVDFDATPSQSVTVASYFRGVTSVLGTARTGAYGGYYTVKRLFDAGLIRYGWQTSAWSGGQWDHRAQLQQYAYGQALDWDRAMTLDYGQWPYATPQPQPQPKPKPHPAGVVCLGPHAVRSPKCEPILVQATRLKGARDSSQRAHDHAVKWLPIWQQRADYFGAKYKAFLEANS